MLATKIYDNENSFCSRFSTFKIFTLGIIPLYGSLMTTPCRKGMVTRLLCILTQTGLSERNYAVSTHRECYIGRVRFARLTDALQNKVTYIYVALLKIMMPMGGDNSVGSSLVPGGYRDHKVASEAIKTTEFKPVDCRIRIRSDKILTTSELNNYSRTSAKISNMVDEKKQSTSHNFHHCVHTACEQVLTVQ